MSIWVLLQGFGLGASMIIPIGAQNAFVLNQGIKKNHHLTTAGICSVLDVIFISLGIFGGGALLSQNETLLNLVTIAGIAFLSFYAFLSFKSAWQAPSEQDEEQRASLLSGRKAVLLGAFAVSALNPHVYIDTVVILGSVGGQFEGSDRMAFAIGAFIASFFWFFSLSIAAAKLSPVLSRPNVKRGIDVFVGAMMVFVAAMLTRALLIGSLTG